MTVIRCYCHYKFVSLIRVCLPGVYFNKSDLYVCIQLLQQQQYHRRRHSPWKRQTGDMDKTVNSTDHVGCGHKYNNSVTPNTTVFQTILKSAATRQFKVNVESIDENDYFLTGFRFQNVYQSLIWLMTPVITIDSTLNRLILHDRFSCVRLWFRFFVDIHTQDVGFSLWLKRLSPYRHPYSWFTCLLFLFVWLVLHVRTSTMSIIFCWTESLMMTTQQDDRTCASLTTNMTGTRILFVLEGKNGVPITPLNTKHASDL